MKISSPSLSWFQYPRHIPMPEREKRQLVELEQQDAALCRNEESIINVRQSLLFKCRYVYRPIQIILGVLLFAIALLIFISLLLSNINKCINFVDFKQIFAQGNRTLFNPIDSVLTWAGKVSQDTDPFEAYCSSFVLSTIRSVIYFSRVYWSISSLHHCMVYNKSVFGTFGFEYVEDDARIP